MNEKYCQCCGMPMGNTDEMYGNNEDGRNRYGMNIQHLMTRALMIIIVQWTK